jgi:hypothetical protein
MLAILLAIAVRLGMFISNATTGVLIALVPIG